MIIAENDRIVVLVQGNPKRTGTYAAQRFTLYKTFNTVGKYVRACVARKYTREKALADISWDAQHKFIRLTR